MAYTTEAEQGAVKLPAHLVAVNFNDDNNLAFVVRAAAVFGAASVMVIGAMPPYRILRQLSVGLSRHVDIVQFLSPEEFVSHCEREGIKIVAIELCEGAVSMFDYVFGEEPVAIVTGHETTGVPTEILRNAQAVYIPMPGMGRSLNTSQAANIAMYEYVRQRGADNNSPLEPASLLTTYLPPSS
jgi:tRNA G18 (ribose-2'-O)-methylase SpoU